MRLIGSKTHLCTAVVSVAWTTPTYHATVRRARQRRRRGGGASRPHARPHDRRRGLARLGRAGGAHAGRLRGGV